MVDPGSDKGLYDTRETLCALPLPYFLSLFPAVEHNPKVGWEVELISTCGVICTGACTGVIAHTPLRHHPICERNSVILASYIDCIYLFWVSVMNFVDVQPQSFLDYAWTSPSRIGGTAPRSTRTSRKQNRCCDQWYVSNCAYF